MGKNWPNYRKIPRLLTKGIADHKIEYQTKKNKSKVQLFDINQWSWSNNFMFKTKHSGDYYGLGNKFGSSLNLVVAPSLTNLRIEWLTKTEGHFVELSQIGINYPGCWPEIFPVWPAKSIKTGYLNKILEKLKQENENFTQKQYTGNKWMLFWTRTKTIGATLQVTEHVHKIYHLWFLNVLEHCELYYSIEKTIRVPITRTYVWHVWNLISGEMTVFWAVELQVFRNNVFWITAMIYAGSSVTKYISKTSIMLHVHWSNTKTTTRPATTGKLCAFPIWWGGNLERLESFFLE